MVHCQDERNREEERENHALSNLELVIFTYRRAITSSDLLIRYSSYNYHNDDQAEPSLLQGRGVELQRPTAGDARGCVLEASGIRTRV